MFHVVLNEPEIPMNTGNVGRLCLATGCTLHLTGRRGFDIDDAAVRRAGLDYWKHVDLVTHDDFAAFEATFSGGRVFCLSARAEKSYLDADIEPGDALVFGRESSGLPPEILERYAARTFRIPIRDDRVRSLNLAVAVGVVVYEGLRRAGG